MVEETIISDWEPVKLSLSDSADIPFLTTKLKEYELRVTKQREENPYAHPRIPTFSDAVYKTALLWVLLNVPGVQIDTWKWSERLHQYGYFYVDQFQNACGVIEDYLNTGGKNTFKY